MEDDNAMLDDKWVKAHAVLVDGFLWTWKATIHPGPKMSDRFPDLSTRYFPTTDKIPDDGTHTVALISVIGPSWGSVHKWLATFTRHEKAPDQYDHSKSTQDIQGVFCKKEWPLTTSGGTLWWKDLTAEVKP